MIKTQYPAIRLIQSDINLGFGKANNIGIKLAYDEGADYFFLLNQDAWVESTTIEFLARCQQKNPGIGILSPLQFYKKGILDFKFKKYLKKQGKVRDTKDIAQNSIILVRFVNAAVWMVSRECIKRTGLFAPIFNHYGEDQNYAHRCTYHKLNIAIYTNAIAYHEREQSHIQEKSISLQKLLNRDRSYCLFALFNIKHIFLRQYIYLFFNSLKIIIKSIFLFRFKTLLMIMKRVKYLRMAPELLILRRKMKNIGAFLDK
jgi:GT2 family glycosyltransferase